MSGPRYVAVSAEPNDRVLYAGPNSAPFPEPPENRVWMEEYRALSAGYAWPDGYVAEEWAASGAIDGESSQSPVVRDIHDRLQNHLVLSNRFLRDLVEVPVTGPVVDAGRAIVRQERALNLVLRALLEVFDSELPEFVTKDTEVRRS